MQKRYRKWLAGLSLLVVLGDWRRCTSAWPALVTRRSRLAWWDRLTAGLEERSQPVEKDGITLKFVIFNDYVQPDVA